MPAPRRRILVLLCAVSALLGACASPRAAELRARLPRLTAESFLPLEPGAERIYEVNTPGYDRRVRLRFSWVEKRFYRGFENSIDSPQFETLPVEYDEVRDKVIYARIPGGPGLHYHGIYYTWILYDPPVPLLPRELILGARWGWQGRFAFSPPSGPRWEESPIRIELELESVTRLLLPEKTVVAIRVVERHESGLEIHRWYTEGIGLVQEEARKEGGVLYRARWVGFQQQVTEAEEE